MRSAQVIYIHIESRDVSKKEFSSRDPLLSASHRL